MMKIDSPLTYTEFYGDNNFDLLETIGGISRPNLIELALEIIYSDNNYRDFKTFCENFFNQNNSPFANSIWNVYQNIVNSKTADEKLISHGRPIASSHTGMELLRLAFSVPYKDSTEFTTDRLQQLIFQCILKINESILEINTEKDESIPEDLKLAYSFLTMYLPYGDFCNQNNYRKLIIQGTKVQAVCDFCSKFPIYQNFLDLYFENIGCRNMEEYIYTLYKLFVITDKIHGSFTRIKMDNNDMDFDRDYKILSSLSIDISKTYTLEENEDYTVFRNYPLIRIGKEEFIVINKTLCLERLYNSIIFSFINLNKELGKPIQDILSDFSTQFSENHMFYNVIKTMFSFNDKMVKLSGEECKIISNNAEPDYYIRNWNDIYLFEFKDPLFSAKTKTSLDINEVKEYLENKLVHKNKSGKNSAVEQLVNNIQRIKENSFAWDSKLNPRKTNIYPILVVGNNRFTLPGVAKIISYYFNLLLDEKGLKDYRIKNLVILDIDTLIFYQEDFAKRNIALKDVLERYYKYLKTQQPYGKEPQYIMKNALHSFFSLSTFMEERYIHKSTHEFMDNIIQKFREANYR